MQELQRNIQVGLELLYQKRRPGNISKYLINKDLDRKSFPNILDVEIKHPEPGQVIKIMSNNSLYTWYRTQPIKLIEDGSNKNWKLENYLFFNNFWKVSFWSSSLRHTYEKRGRERKRRKSLPRVPVFQNSRNFKDFLKTLSMPIKF